MAYRDHHVAISVEAKQSLGHSPAPIPPVLKWLCALYSCELSGRLSLEVDLRIADYGLIQGESREHPHSVFFKVLPVLHRRP